jgi:archaellum component FlaF (FlaF/FlaG flagellin family)
VVFAAAGLMLMSVPEANSQTARVSVASDGSQGNDTSQQLTMTPDARLVSFFSLATNLVPGDTNEQRDVFVHDRSTHTTTRVSVSSTGSQGNGEAGYAQLSADGTTIVFAGGSDNLVPGDGNHAHDIFVRDLLTGTTTMVSVSSTGQQGNRRSRRASISGDGRFVAFRSDATNLVPGDTNGSWDIFVRDRMTHVTTRVSVASDGSEANGTSIRSSISNDGRFVVFSSEASNLVPGDTNGFWDIFVHDRLTGATTRRSFADDGSQANYECWMESAVSTDGTTVAFFTGASNIVPGDTNDRGDIFVSEAIAQSVQPIPTVGTVGGVIFLIALSVAGLRILRGRHAVSTETVLETENLRQSVSGWVPHTHFPTLAISPPPPHIDSQKS